MILLSLPLLAAALASADPGQALFDAHGCRSCHSVGGVGGDAGPDLTFVGFRRAEAWLDRWLASPRAWKHDTLMPDFKLTEASRRALVAYLGSLKGQGFDRRTPRSGKRLFAEAGCVACHGAGGRGGHPNNNVRGNAVPALLPDLVSTYTREELVAKIKRGVVPEKLDPAGLAPLVRMPAWGEVLSDAEIGEIAGYLLALAPKRGKESW